MSTRQTVPTGRHPDDSRRHPRITRRWVKTALVAHREAFEEEMARHRRDLDRRFDRFWRTQRPA